MTIEMETPPAVPLAEARAYLRAGGGADDAEIGRWIGAATQACEAFTRLALVERACVEVRSASGEWQRLGVGPVRSITSVEGLPADGAAFALAVDAYAVDIDAHGEGRVRVSRPGAAGRVRVAYVAGAYPSAAAVPDGLRSGVLMLVAELARGRDGGAVRSDAAEALWRPWRRVRLS